MPFVLVYPSGDYDGPFLPELAETQPDGSVVLLSDGLPRVLRVVEQDGSAIRTSDSGLMTFEPFE